MSRDSIKVVCRIRPENKIEMDGNYKRCLEYNQTNIKVIIENDGKAGGDKGSHEFSLDRVFGAETRQNDVFEEVAKGVVDGVLTGFNGTIFAYGQTGSGKTFTMEGLSLNDEENKGIIPRMVDYLFGSIMNASEDIEFQVKCSFLEIYMEKIQDLLDPRKTNLHIKEEKGRGISVQDATEVYVSATDEMLEVMRAGSKNRSIAATRMNERSSRSHSLFILTVFQRNTKTDASKMARLYFVDLAGSEKISKTNVTGQQLEEAKMINKSLSALGNVINALTDTKNKHVPYRDSKLTRILQESLGGNSLTVLIITCSMSSYNDKETLSTLRFGSRAKNIKNKPIANVERSAKELMQQLGVAETNIKKLTEIIKIMHDNIEGALKSSDKMQENFEGLKKKYRGMKLDDLDGMLKKLKGESSKEKEAAPSEISKVKKEEKGKNLSKVENSADLSSSISSSVETSLKLENTSLKMEEKKDDTASEIEGLGEKTQDLEDSIKTSKTDNNPDKEIDLFKQQLELYSLKEELERLKAEKSELENEVLQRNKEIFEANEKLILWEVNSTMAQQQKIHTIQDLQMTLDRMTNSQEKCALDLRKIKQCLERLKYDMQLMAVSKKLSQSSRILRTDDDDDSEIETSLAKNSIQETLDAIVKFEESLDIDAFLGKDFNDIKRNTFERRPAQRNALNAEGQPISGNWDESGQNEILSTATDEEIRMFGYTPAYTPDESLILTEKNESAETDRTEEEEGSVKTQSRTEITDKKEDSSKEVEKLRRKKEKYKEELKKVRDSKNQELEESDSMRETTKKAVDDLEDQLSNMKKEFEEYKKQTEKDFLYKEEQIIKLHTRTQQEREELERIIEVNPDKKIMYSMQCRVKDLQRENHSLINELAALRKAADTREDALRNAQLKASKLEKRLMIQSNLTRFDASSMPLAGSFCTPSLSARGKGNFHKTQFSTYGELISEQMGKKGMPITVPNMPNIFQAHAKIIKPIRGGGGKNTVGSKFNDFFSNAEVSTANPYSSKGTTDLATKAKGLQIKTNKPPIPTLGTNTGSFEPSQISPRGSRSNLPTPKNPFSLKASEKPGNNLQKKLQNFDILMEAKRMSEEANRAETTEMISDSDEEKLSDEETDFKAKATNPLKSMLSTFASGFKR